ncbi:MAG: glycosyltransferase [Candidatus Omnitrophota bacterium]
MTVSIIIAVKTWQKNLEECVNNCLKLDFSEFEIIILPDDPIDRDSLQIGGAVPIKIIPTQAINPARKRDIAITRAKGEILAFLDDDAYPDRAWLKNALINFADQEIAAVGGPAITPPSDSLEQKASGLIYASVLVSGTNLSCRYSQQMPRKEVVDFPSCNFLVRKSIMVELGGFNTNFWPGEDTKLCLDIIKLGKKIIYDPNVLVYHHRRKVFKPHLNQIANYALHRGYFVKRYPETSLKITFFLPSLLLLGVLVGGLLSIFILGIRNIYILAIFLYIILVSISSIFNGFKVAKMELNLGQKVILIGDVFVGIILTHLCYGFFFIQGLITSKLSEE